MIVGIILAAGKGTRLKSTESNKVTLLFHNKPLIKYAVELFEGICDRTVIVVGAFADSVRKILRGVDIDFVHQEEQLGTGHGVKVALEKITDPSPTLVLVGYGDHMMFYKKETVKKLLHLHHIKKAVITLITTHSPTPNELAWGRIIRDEKGNVVDNVEQKDATQEQKKISELNAGFYCFDQTFLKSNIHKIEKSPVSGEYYINYLVKIAINQGLNVAGLTVPFHEVGIGINTKEEHKNSEELFRSLR